jgi:hypothetical protein
MGLFGINFGKVNGSASGISAIWDMQLRSNIYTEIYLNAIFTRILSEVFYRSEPISDEFRRLLRTSYAGSGQKGLIEYIVCAMVGQKDLVLKYEAGILHEPNYGEKSKILDDVKKGTKLEQTLVLSFREYHKVTVLRQYLLHKYLLLCTQNKALNISTALQLKIDGLRSTVGMKDFKSEGGPYDQAKEIVNALLDGRPAVLDSKDTLDLLAPDISPLKEVSSDLHSEMAFILGMPISWISGIQKGGLGDSGDADARAIERGLEPYFWESAYPSFESLFGVKLKFQTEDYRNIQPALEAMRTFQLDEGELLPKEIQQKILYQLLDIKEVPPAIAKPKQITDQARPGQRNAEATEGGGRA